MRSMGEHTFDFLLQGILAMKPFINVFGTYDTKSDAYVLTAKRESLVTSIIQVGEVLGAASAWWIGDKIGRKGGLYVTSSCVIVGAILQCASTKFVQLIFGRIIVGKLQ